MLEKLLSIGIPILISLFALWVSFRTRQDANENNRQQILVGKLEEIYELTTELQYYYMALKFLFDSLEESHNVKYPAEQRAELLEVYRNHREEFKVRNNTDELYTKTSRLKVLSNAYLNDELKEKFLSYNDLLEKLLVVTLQEQMFLKSMFYKEGFPENLTLHNYLESLHEELISLINLGGKSLKVDDIAKYRESIFKYDVGLKNLKQ